jgi:hypothetical protein
VSNVIVSFPFSRPNTQERSRGIMSVRPKRE